MTKSHMSFKWQGRRSLRTVTAATRLRACRRRRHPDGAVVSRRSRCGREGGRRAGSCFHVQPAVPGARPRRAAGDRSGSRAATGRAESIAVACRAGKVFDNLYFLGQTEFSAWAVTTSAGIILIDTIFDYSVEDEVVGGLKKLGLDPATIKYAIVSHGHGDHSGGAKYLQDHFRTRIILSAADWDLLDAAPAPSRSATWWPPTARSSRSATRR